MIENNEYISIDKETVANYIFMNAKKSAISNIHITLSK